MLHMAAVVNRLPGKYSGLFYIMVSY